MSRSKRRHDDHDDDDGSDGADDSRVSKRSRDGRSPVRQSTPLANTGQQSNGRSRQRPGTIEPRSIDDNGDDEDEGEGQTSHFLPKVEMASQVQLSNGGAQGDDDEDDEMGSQDELEEEEDEESQQQQIAQIKEMRSQGAHVAESGVIERIELVNFMCHKRLTVPFGPQTNFIIGHNGSGKSAVLTGITLALGGKAASTNRGNSIKSFVKEGCGAAEIVLWMKNRGPEAFKRDVYGDRIVIERRINADGSGQWKMRSAQGKLVSNKRDELNAYCDHANIQVDNPMNVLTQDAARQFLSSSNSSEMYDFFLKGTQLKQLSDEYDLITQNIHRIKRTIATKEEALPDLENATREAARKYKLVEKQTSERGRLQQLKNQMVWAQVKEKQRIYEKALEAGERARLKKSKLEEHLQRLTTQLTELNAKVTELDARNSDENDRSKPMTDEREALKAELKTLRSELRKIRDEESEQSNQYTHLSKTADDLTNRIDEEANKLAQGNRERHREHEQQRQELEEQRRQYAEEEASIRDELRNVDPKAKELGVKEQQAGEQRERLRDELHQREDQCNRLLAASSNKIEAFGKGVPQLINAIKNEGRWRKPPIGPIGAHIKVRDSKWTPVLESVIGNTLNAFCVTNHRDRQLLEDLKRRIGCQAPILTGSDEAFDYSHGEPPQDVLTILRVIDVDDDFVLRRLVNAVHIECSALVERRVDGDHLMRRNIPNVKFCFSADMFQLKGGAVGSTTQTLNPYKGPPRLSTDVKARLEEARAAYAETQAQLTKCQRELEGIKRERTEAHETLRKGRERLQKTSRKHIKARDDLARFEEDLRADEPANVGALEAARTEAREELERCREAFEDVQRRKEELENKIAPKDERFKELRTLIEQFADAQGAQRLALQNAVEDRVKCQQESKTRATSLAKITEELVKIEEEEEDAKDDWQTGEEQALQYTDGERFEASHSHEYYEKEIQAVENLLEEAKRQGGGSLEEVVIEYNARKKAYEDAKREMDAMKAATKALTSALNRRLAMWQSFRQLISLRARSMFTLHLSNRGYTGSLHFNHDAQRLSIKVQTDDPTATGSRASKNKDPRSLSGGEKSFSTICLLLSLWEAIGCPIRCLDEFDVFMDAVNRRISMKMIIDESKTSHNVQYVLITPQNMGNTTFGPEVNVQRLNDPERGQGVLEFGS